MGSGYEPGELIRELPETFRFDHREAMGSLQTGTAVSSGVLVWLSALLGCFIAGGWLQVMLEHAPGGTLRRFFFGGSRFFFRFFRVFLLTLLLMHLIGWLVNGEPWERFVHQFLFGIEGGDLEELESETTARRLVWARDLTYMALVALIFVWGAYTRTRLALHDTQSAVWAGLCTWALLFLHPIRTLRPMVFMLGAQALVLLAAGLLAAWFQGMLGEPRRLAAGRAAVRPDGRDDDVARDRARRQLPRRAGRQREPGQAALAPRPVEEVDRRPRRPAVPDRRGRRVRRLAVAGVSSRAGSAPLASRHPA